MEDRRRSARVRSIFDLRVLDTDLLRIIGRLEDVSRRGICVINEQPVTPGKVYQLELVVPLAEDATERIAFSAKCVWKRQDPEDGSCRSGFRFLRVGPKNMAALERLLGDGFLLARQDGDRRGAPE